MKKLNKTGPSTDPWGPRRRAFLEGSPAHSRWESNLPGSSREAAKPNAPLPEESVYAGTRGSPLPQGDPGQLDQVPHAGGDEDGGFIAVPGFVVALHLLHHELGMSQERVLCEAVEVEPRGRHGGLRGGVG